MTTTPARRAAVTLPNFTELAFPLSEWVLFVMHSDTSRAYLRHPATYTLAAPTVDQSAFATDEDRFGLQDSSA